MQTTTTVQSKRRSPSSEEPIDDASSSSSTEDESSPSTTATTSSSSSTKPSSEDRSFAFRSRRSRSIGDLKEYESRLRRFENFVATLPGKLRDKHHYIQELRRIPALLLQNSASWAGLGEGRRGSLFGRRPSLFGRRGGGALQRNQGDEEVEFDPVTGQKLVSENKMEPDDSMPKTPLSFKVVMVVLMPFFPVFLYALLFFFSSWFQFMYLLFILCYFAVLVAWIITEIAIRPPWYIPTKPEEGLTDQQIPAYWQGICHNPKYDLGLDYDDVEFFSEKNNCTLRGWFIGAAPTSSVTTPKAEDGASKDKSATSSGSLGIVFVHGGGRDRRAFLRHVPLFYKQGYGMLLFDFSEHGTSDSTTRGFSYGIREQHDVHAAVKWMKEQKGFRRIVVFGTSVGGSSVIMAAASDPDNRIDAVIAENPVACAEEFAIFHLKKMLSVYAPKTSNSIFIMPFYKLVALIFLIRIGALTKGYERPYLCVSKLSPRPLLLMHGTSDDLVPPQHSELIYANAKEPRDLWLAKDAWHCALYDKDPVEYGVRVHAFLNKYFHSEVPPSPRPRSSSLLSSSVSTAGVTPTTEEVIAEEARDVQRQRKEEEEQQLLENENAKERRKEKVGEGEEEEEGKNDEEEQEGEQAIRKGMEEKVKEIREEKERHNQERKRMEREEETEVKNKLQSMQPILQSPLKRRFSFNVIDSLPVPLNRRQQQLPKTFSEKRFSITQVPTQQHLSNQGETDSSHLQTN
ncbi:X-linked retinitis pigmentosa GTPase regulator [Balamuthia mandrillaris]